MNRPRRVAAFVAILAALVTAPPLASAVAPPDLQTAGAVQDTSMLWMVLLVGVTGVALVAVTGVAWLILTRHRDGDEHAGRGPAPGGSLPGGGDAGSELRPARRTRLASADDPILAAMGLEEGHPHAAEHASRQAPRGGSRVAVRAAGDATGRRRRRSR